MFFLMRLTYINKKFRMWFKYGLNAQKLLAQGNALGIIAVNKAPCKGKSFTNYLVLKLLPLQGDRFTSIKNPGRCPGLGASALSGRVESTYCSSITYP